MTSKSQSHTPLPQLVERLNRHLRDWASYFSYGCPRGVRREVAWFVRGRLIRHLGRRSQRPFRPPKGAGWYEHLQSFGLVLLNQLPARRTVHARGDLFGRAGCRKIARPVRRGERRLRVPSYSTGPRDVSRAFHSARVRQGARRPAQSNYVAPFQDGCQWPIPVLNFHWSSNDRAMHRGMFRTAAEIYREAGAALPRHDSASMGGLASHEVGTVRIGKNPKTSVLNRWNQAREARNLFVAVGSCFATFPEKNPPLAIVALALRAADSILSTKNRNEL